VLSVLDLTALATEKLNKAQVYLQVYSQLTGGRERSESYVLSNTFASEHKQLTMSDDEYGNVIIEEPASQKVNYRQATMQCFSVLNKKHLGNGGGCELFIWC
jgi:hypothetical protein